MAGNPLHEVNPSAATIEKLRDIFGLHDPTATLVRDNGSNSSISTLVVQLTT